MPSSRDALKTVLHQGEKILASVDAADAGNRTVLNFGSCLALTDIRVVAVSTSALSKVGIASATPSTVSIALAEISACDFRKGKLLWKNGSKNVVVVQERSGEYAWSTPDPRSGEAFATRVDKAIRGRTAAPAAAPPAATPPGPSVTDELERLAGLLERGVLTREEFDAQKQRLLAFPVTPEAPLVVQAPTAWKVVLLDGGLKKIQVIKVVRAQRPELGLREARALVDQAPVRVVTTTDGVEAERLAAALRNAGGRAVARADG